VDCDCGDIGGVSVVEYLEKTVIIAEFCKLYQQFIASKNLM